MKVVLFCGGLGLRLRDYSEDLPKPMVRVGKHPILWQVMRYYAHFGHKDFILCLGYKGEVIKDYFLNYEECMSNDFILSDGGRRIELFNQDVEDWTITFVDTGIEASIGERLKAVQPHLKGEDVFLANYTDGLTDLDLNQYLDFATEQDKIATFLSVRPTASFHVVESDPDGSVTRISPVDEATRINCGYFVLKQQIFDEMREGDDLVTAPFQRLIAKQQLATFNHEGFWECMDTFKDRQMLETMVRAGDKPWQVWAKNRTPSGPR